jgi:hypothetical protein
MDYQQAESRFRVLQARRDAGEMDEQTFRLGVAKLLLQDERGVLWMLDADQGTWVCNRGEGWEPGDPRDEPPPPAPDAGRGFGHRVGRWLALGMVLLCLLAFAGFLVLWQGNLDVSWNPFQPTPTPATQVSIMIASPADGSQVSLGQEIAIESTVDAMPDLRDVGRVVLEVNGQKVDTLLVLSQTQVPERSLPISQPWRPEAVGEHQVAVVVYSTENELLGTAAIGLQVEAAPDEALVESACIPDASFLADVTIPPGTAFPPSARMDKVWQVRNNGTCAWGVGYELVQLARSELISPDTVPVPPTAAGEAVDLAVTLWAPAEVGAYANLWRLRSPEGDLFGPTLPLTIYVEALAQKDLPPDGPVDLQAVVDADGAVAGSRPRPSRVRLTWSDESANEDAFRIYRADMDASIGLAPANTEQFVDEQVACGNTYLYSVAAFNAAGTSARSATVEVSMPPCAPADEPPLLDLRVAPTQVRANEPSALVFRARDDIGLNMVVVWGVETEDPALNSGRAFTCTQVLCAGSWPLTWTQPSSIPVTLVAVAFDSLGQKSEPAWLTFTILPPRLISPQLSITDSATITNRAPVTDQVLITDSASITE